MSDSTSPSPRPISEIAAEFWEWERLYVYFKAKFERETGVKFNSRLAQADMDLAWQKDYDRLWDMQDVLVFLRAQITECARSYPPGRLTEKNPVGPQPRWDP